MSLPFESIAPQSYDEERATIAAAQAGDPAAMETLVRAQVRYVMGEARKMASATVSEDDLFQAGVSALVQAVETFDLARVGVRLIVHAKTAIRAAMNEERAALTTAVAIPGRTLRRFETARRATGSMEAAADYAVSVEGMDRRTFYAVAEALNGFQSVDATVRHDDGSEERVLADLHSDVPAPEPTAISRALVTSIVHAAGLDDRSREVVALAFGFAGEALTDAEIAAALGLSRQSVGRIRNAALSVLRQAAQA